MDNTNKIWQTKPSDRFILKYIKTRLSAPVTLALIGHKWLRPWIITCASMLFGISGGILFALQHSFLAALLALCSQILDGVDGQFARLTNSESNKGAYLDSVLDRYTDGSLVIGLTLFTLTQFDGVDIFILISGSLALIGSGLISYSSCRAETLSYTLGRYTLASKGTRTTAIIIAGLLSWFSPIPCLMAIVYLGIHTNIVVCWRIYLVYKQTPKSD